MFYGDWDKNITKQTSLARITWPELVCSSAIMVSWPDNSLVHFNIVSLRSTSVGLFGWSGTGKPDDLPCLPEMETYVPVDRMLNILTDVPRSLEHLSLCSESALITAPGQPLHEAISVLHPEIPTRFLRELTFLQLLLVLLYASGCIIVVWESLFIWF